MDKVRAAADKLLADDKFRNTFEGAVFAEHKERILQSEKLQRIMRRELAGFNVLMAPVENSENLKYKEPEAYNIKGERVKEVMGIGLGSGVDKETVDKVQYLAKTGIQGSLLGMALRHQLPEYDEEMEAQLSSTDKVTRMLLGMGPDLPFLLMGGGIPKFGTALLSSGVKTAPFLAKAIPKLGPMGHQIWGGSAGMGFLSGVRKVFYDNIVEGDVMSLEDFQERMFGATLETVKGQAMGAIAGGGGYLRAGRPLVQQAPMLTLESAAISGLQASMESFGSLPTAEDFTQAMAMDFMTEAVFGLVGTKATRRVRSPRKEVVDQVTNVPWMNGRVDDMVIADRVAQNRWYADKYEQAFVEYGVLPSTLVKDSYFNIDVMDSLSDPTRFNIRPYDENSGRENIVDGEETIKYAEDFSVQGALGTKLPDQPTEGPKQTPVEVPKQAPVKEEAPTKASGQGEAKDMKATPDSSIEQAGTLIPDSAMNPFNLKEGDQFQVVRSSAGDIVLPLDQNKRMAMSPLNRLHNSSLVALVLDITGKFPKFTDIGEGILGQMIPAGKATKSGNQLATTGIGLKIDSLTKGLKSAKRTRNTLVKKGEATHNIDRYIEFVEGQISELRKSDVRDPPKANYKKNQVGIRISKDIVFGNEETGIKPPENPEELRGRVIATLTHEIGHLIDYVSDGWAKGESEILSPLIERFGAFRNMSQRAISELSGLQEVARQLIEKDIDALSMAWRPIDENSYRNSEYRQYSFEKIADVNSVILSNPELARQIAPTFMKFWDGYLANRPDDAQIVTDLMEALNNGTSTLKAAEYLRGKDQGFGRAEELAKEAAHLRNKAAVGGVKATWNSLMNAIMDTAWAARKYVKNDIKTLDKIEQYQFVGTTLHAYAEGINKKVFGPLKKAGISNEEMGMLLFYNRNMNDNDRQMIMNAFGFDTVSSKAESEALYDKLRKKGDIDKILNDFYQFRQDSVVKLAEESGLFSDAFLEKIKANREYATFNLNKYYEKRILAESGSFASADLGNVISAGEAYKRKQTGSIEGIVNPLAATLENDLVLIQAIRRGEAMRSVADKLQELDGPIMTKAEWDFFEKQGQFNPDINTEKFNIFKRRGIMKRDMRKISTVKRIPRKEKQTINGKTVLVETGDFTTTRAEYYVPKTVADMFNGAPAVVKGYHAFVSAPLSAQSGWGKVGGAALKSVYAFNNIFRFFAITANVAFQSANIPYDAGRTFFNAPVVKGKYASSYIPIVGMAKPYVAAIKSQWGGRDHGEFSEIYQEMLMKGLVTEGSRFGEDIDGTDIAERIVSKHTNATKRDENIVKPWDRVTEGAKKISGGFQKVLDFTEGTQNEAAYRYLKQNQDKLVVKRDGKKVVGATDAEVRTMARSWVAAPAYRRRGAYSTGINALAPFSNTVKEGVRGDWKAFSNNRTAYMTKVFTCIVVPVIAQTLMELGYFGEENADIMETQSEYTKSSGFIVPLKMDVEKDQGMVARLPMPMNIGLRTIASVTRQTIITLDEAYKNGDVDASKTIQELLAVASSGATNVTSEIPTMGPIRLAANLPKIMGGSNVPSTFRSGGDYFTGSEIQKNNAELFSDKAFYRLKGAARYTLDTMALNNVSKLLRDHPETFEFVEGMKRLNNPPEDADLSWYADTASKGLLIPALSYGFSAYIKKGDGGIKEKLYKVRKKEEAHRASVSIKADKNLSALQEGKVPDIKEFADIKALKRADRSVKIDAIKNPHVKRYYQHTTKAEREFIMDRQRRMSKYEATK